MKHCFPTFRYTKLKLVAVKLKKKTVEQEKRICQLTAAAGAGQANPKVSELAKNLGNLQAQYDTVQDKVEEQNGKIKALEQDLTKSIQVSSQWTSQTHPVKKFWQGT